jgi:subtilisin family serine protease
VTSTTTTTRRPGALLLAALLAAASAEAGELTPAHRSAARLLAGSDEAYAAGQLVVKLEPAAARAAIADGRAPVSLGSPSLDALAAAHGVVSARRVFTGFDGAGRAAHATERAAEVRARHARRSARAPARAALPELENVLLLELAPQADVPAAVAAFAARPEVVYAEPNFLFRSTALPLPAVPFVPDDRFVTGDGLTWSEGSWGQSFPDLYGLRNLRAIEAWNEFDLDGDGNFGPGEPRPGEGVVVAVVDSGMDVAHPDLAASVWVNPGEVPANGIDDDANGFVDDVNGWDFVDADAVLDDPRGHGSHVAGTVAAVADNGAGVAGVAPWARLMGVRGLNASGVGTATNLADAVVYAVDNGADILQNSWGSSVPAAVILDAFAYADALGVLSVAAAGNSSADVEGFTPAGIDSVLSVAAVDDQDVRASFSNYGYDIDVSAPGVAVLSLNAHGGANDLAATLPERVVETDYLWLNGTSMACPHVTGAAALLMSARPAESLADLRGRLRAGAAPIDAGNPGFASLLGSGRVDVLASLRAESGPALQIADVASAPLVPGRSAELVVTLRNFWREAPGLEATLLSGHPQLAVSQAQASYGDLEQGESESNADHPFVLALDAALPFGTEIPLTLELRDEEGRETRKPFTLSVSYFHAVPDAGLPLVDILPLDVRAADYDRDGDADLAYVRYLDFDVYRQQRARFEEATAALGIGEHGGLGRLVGLFFELDADGWPDLLVGGTSAAGNFLYQSQERGSHFEDVSATALPPSLSVYTLIALDVDRDGATDLVGGRTSPVLLHNQGDGTFVDATEGSGLTDFSPLIGQIVAFDYDGDGDQDLVGVSDASHTAVFRNEGAGVFQDVTASTGLRHPLGGGYGLAAGDVDGDGWIDVLLTGLGSPDEPQRNALFHNLGNGRFRDVTAQSGDLALGGPSGFISGTAFFDFDQDGDLDLYLNSEGVGERPFNELFRNDGGGRFTRITEQAFPRGIAPAGAASAIFDYDGDGDLDIFAPTGTASGGGPGALLENLAGTGRWLMLDLQRAGGIRDVWGARVVVTAGDLTLTREVMDAPLVSNPLHFGLGDARRVERVEIHWPDGSVQEIEGLLTNRLVSVEQGVDPCLVGPDSDGDGLADACDAHNDAPALGPAAQLLLVALLGAGGWRAARRRGRARAATRGA